MTWTSRSGCALARPTGTSISVLECVTTDGEEVDLLLSDLASQYRDVHVLGEMIVRCEGGMHLLGEGGPLI